jgi:hypothetical protein
MIIKEKLFGKTVRKHWWPSLRHYPRIGPKGLWKTRKSLSKI